MSLMDNLRKILDAGNRSLASGYWSLVTCRWLLELVGTEAEPTYTKWFTAQGNRLRARCWPDLLPSTVNLIPYTISPLRPGISHQSPAASNQRPEACRQRPAQVFIHQSPL
jgi:hypothetical protein